MIIWLKRRFEILRRNLTPYEWGLVVVMTPILSTISTMVVKSVFEQMRPAVGEQLETLLVCTLLFFTPIVLLRVGYLLLFEPDRHQLPDAIGNQTVRFETFFVSMPEQIRSVNALVRNVFPETTIPDRIVEEILTKNNHATLALYQRKTEDGKFSANQEMVGCASCWPVTEDVYRGVLTNTMNEDQILPRHVYADGETEFAEHFYVPVLLVRDWNNELGRLQATALLVAFSEHIRTIHAQRGGRRTKIFFVGFTREGIGLARRLGFRKRADVVQYGVAKREFFELDLTPQSIAVLSGNERRILLRAIGLRQPS